MWAANVAAGKNAAEDPDCSLYASTS
jgi:hypothetical protein